LNQLKTILPENVDWKPFAAFPSSVRLAVIVGQPSEPGPYLIRVKVPGGVKLMPHRHSEDRIYTVISGVFYIGVGEEFDPDRLEAYPPGAVIVLPGNTSHFHWAKSGEYISQVTAIGPLGFEYVNSKDDPRNENSERRGPRLPRILRQNCSTPLHGSRIVRETSANILTSTEALCQTTIPNRVRQVPADAIFF